MDKEIHLTGPAAHHHLLFLYQTEFFVFTLPKAKIPNINNQWRCQANFRSAKVQLFRLPVTG